MTIDDAPTEDVVWKAEYLLSKGIPAIWYYCSDALEKYFNQALEVINLGFVIGNHSYSHIHFPELSIEEEACRQIILTDKIIENLYRDWKESNKYPSW